MARVPMDSSKQSLLCFTLARKANSRLGTATVETRRDVPLTPMLKYSEWGYLTSSCSSGQFVSQKTAIMIKGLEVLHEK